MAKKNLSASKMIGKCPECGSIRLTRYYEDADIVCMDCGFVATSKIADHTAEENSVRKRREKLKVRYGETTAMDIRHCNGIDLRDNITLNHRVQNRLLEMWWRTARISDATEKNLALALSEITKLGGVLSLPKSVLEKAATTYKTIVEKRYVGGRNIRTLGAAAVYLACKQCGLARTLNDVAIASKISRRKVGRGYKFLVKQLGCFSPPVEPVQYLQKFLTQLTISEETEEIIDKILKITYELKLTSGRDPMGVVAAASYVALRLTGEKKTQREIAEASRVTEVTIRNRYKEIVKHLLFIVAL